MTQTTIDFARGDDLSDILGNPERSQPLPQAPEFVRIRETVSDFTERCPKCHGSGNFTGRNGRVFGQCFACKGKGSQSFKTSPEKRADGREFYARQKEQRLAEYAKAQPEAFAWMTREAPRFEFAANMLDAIRTYGDLTERQAAAVQKCVDKAGQRQQASEDRATIIDAAKIAAAFETAQANGLKRPKLIVGGLKFTLAPLTSRNPGAIYVKTRPGAEYLGKITNGKFYPTREATPEQIAAVVMIAADPAAAAKAHGDKTGECSCCGAALSNAESIALGIGPICRSKYGF